MKDKDIIFGRRAVSEALRAGVPIEKIFVLKDVKPDRAVNDICDQAKSFGVEVVKKDKRAIDQMVEGYSGGAHQGVVALSRPFEYTDIEAIAASCADLPQALIVVCDHITDAGNLGAVIRSAESAGASGVVIPSRRAAQVTPVTYKTSAGAVSHIPIAQVANISRALDVLKDAGFWAVAATEHAESLLWDTDMEDRIALVMGGEHDGVSDLVLKNCDMRCKLPQMGSISSLNVAQASTVFMYEWVRQNVGNDGC